MHKKFVISFLILEILLNIAIVFSVYGEQEQVAENSATLLGVEQNEEKLQNSNSLQTSAKYVIDDENKIIKRVLPETKVVDFKAKFNMSENIVVYEDETCAKEIKDGYIATGMVLKAINNEPKDNENANDVQTDLKNENNEQTDLKNANDVQADTKDTNNEDIKDENKNSSEIYKISVIGDLDKDGIMNEIELNRLIKHVVGLKQHKITSLNAISADINGEGNIDQIDITLLVRWIVYKI